MQEITNMSRPSSLASTHRARTTGAEPNDDLMNLMQSEKKKMKEDARKNLEKL
jgi:hypothetical protein